MLTIKFLNLTTHETETENFADYAAFEILDDAQPVAVLEWSHFDEQGNKTGGGSGMNACVSLRACHAGLSQDAIDDIHFQMSVNCD